MGDRKKILVVDDKKQFADFIKMRLEANNFDAVIALDGIEGMKKVEDEKPDLILLDILMPNLDGFGMLAKLRERTLSVQKETRSIPVIMLTGDDNPDDVEKCLELGADDYIVKPFKSELLLEKIRRLL